jgi:dTDP-4-dehydrorhamnose 3,5-epimerase
LKIAPLKLPGAYQVTLEPIGDSRGYFVRTYDEAIFRDNGLQTSWIQESQSLTSGKHTVRGIHFQRAPHAETKLVRVLRGAILDVFVDLRKDSPTYGEWDSVELSEDNNFAVYLSKGLGHGFCSLTDSAVVAYKMDYPYVPEAAGDLRWNDPAINIKWPTDDPKLSEKDAAAPFLERFEPIDLSNTS